MFRLYSHHQAIYDLRDGITRLFSAFGIPDDVFAASVFSASLFSSSGAFLIMSVGSQKRRNFDANLSWGSR
jgi:hypothetical protein